MADPTWRNVLLIAPPRANRCWGRRRIVTADCGERCEVEIRGRMQPARVVGTVDGETVDARLSRANGCEIARWTALGPLLAGHDPA